MGGAAAEARGGGHAGVLKQGVATCPIGIGELCMGTYKARGYRPLVGEKMPELRAISEWVSRYGWNSQRQHRESATGCGQSRACSGAARGRAVVWLGSGRAPLCLRH